MKDDFIQKCDHTTCRNYIPETIIINYYVSNLGSWLTYAQ